MKFKASVAYVPPKGKFPDSAPSIRASMGTTSSNGGAAERRSGAVAETSHGRTADFESLLRAMELLSPEPRSADDAKVTLQAVLRVATRVALAGAVHGPSSHWPEIHVVEEAATTLFASTYAVDVAKCPFTFGAQVDLWSRPGPSLTLVKALAVALRRADDAAVEKRERSAYYRLSKGLLQSFSVTVTKVMAASMSGSESTHPQLQRTARALVRSGVLQCLSRSMAAGDASRDTGGLACTPHEFLGNAVLLLSSLLVVFVTERADDSANSGGGPTDPTTELLDALADSHLLEHAAKHIGAGGKGEWHFTELLPCFRLILCLPARRAMAHERELPGPCLHFLLTAAAVDALSALDGGPSYGLPAEAAQMAKELRQRLSVVNNRHATEEVLLSWALLQTPGAGMPTRSCISPAATYELCTRACASCVRAALDSRGAAGAGWCHTAVAALVAAHDALEQQRQQQRARSSAAGSAASPGPLQARPHDWWQAGVEALGAAAAAAHGDRTARGVGELLEDTELLLSYQLDKGQLSLPLPGALHPSPPADVASALSCGYLPCLERNLRRSKAMPNPSLLSWPQLGWLLAYGDRRQAAALVATIGKLLWLLTRSSASEDPVLDALRRAVHLSLDSLDWLQARREALTPAGGGGRGLGSSSSGTPVEGGSNCGAGASSSGIGGGCSSSEGRGGESSSGAGMEAGGCSSGDGVVSSGSGGPAQAPEDAAPGQQLRLIVGYMLAQWLPQLVQWGRIFMAYHMDKAAGGSATAQCYKPAEFIVNLLRLLSRALDPCRREEMPPAEKQAWGQVLLEQADVMGFLECIAPYASSGYLPSLGMLRLRRLLRLLLVSFPAAMHTDLRGWDGKAFCAFLALFAPDGPRPDPQLVGLLEAARTGGAAGGAGVRPPPPEPKSSGGLPGPQPLLPPLLEVQPLLRVCGYVRCENLAGDSETGVKLRKGSGSGLLWFCSGSCEREHRASLAEQCPAAMMHRKVGGGRRKGR